MHRFLTSRWTKAALFLLCLEPLYDLVDRLFSRNLGAKPVEYITKDTGVFSLFFLLLTLAISPFRRLFFMPDLIGFRRMLGLLAFFYACLHLTTYLWLDKVFDTGEIWRDVWKRPFVIAGATSLLLMLPLALTSMTG